jgi:hypothetical protein
MCALSTIAKPSLIGFGGLSGHAKPSLNCECKFKRCPGPLRCAALEALDPLELAVRHDSMRAACLTPSRVQTERSEVALYGVKQALHIRLALCVQQGLHQRASQTSSHPD